MSQKRSRSISPADSRLEGIFKSSVIEDRSSKFIAFFSPTLDPKTLADLEEVQSAMHRMVAWRTRSKQQSLSSQPVLDLGHDDDGEKYGGKTLEKVLTTRRVEGVVMIARWYGGVLLGPVRFEHMRQCANEAITQWAVHLDRSSKRPKSAVAQSDTEQLMRTLKDRDESILVLRDLLAEKTSSSAPTAGQGIKIPDYSTLQPIALQRLEAARDKTIAWLLLEIDKAEAQHTHGRKIPS